MKVFSDYSKLYKLFQCESFWSVVRSVCVSMPPHRRARAILGLVLMVGFLLGAAALTGPVAVVALAIGLLSYVLFLCEWFGARVRYLSLHDADDVKTAWVLEADYQNVRIGRFVDNVFKAELGEKLDGVLRLAVTLRETRSSSQWPSHPGVLTLVASVFTVAAGTLAVKEEGWSALVITLLFIALVPSVGYVMVKSIELNRHKTFERFLRCALLDERATRPAER